MGLTGKGRRDESRHRRDARRQERKQEMQDGREIKSHETKHRLI